MIESMHTGIMVNVRNGGEVSDTFDITNGVKQGCVMAPTFFYQKCLKRLLETREGRSLHTVTPECRPLYRCTLQSEDKTTNIFVREPLFAEDSPLIAHSAEEIQRIVDVFATPSSKFGLKINIKNRSDV